MHHISLRSARLALPAAVLTAGLFVGAGPHASAIPQAGRYCPPDRTAVMGTNAHLYRASSGTTFVDMGGALAGAPAVVAIHDATGPCQDTTQTAATYYYIVTGDDHQLYVRTESTPFHLLANPKGSYCIDNPAALWNDNTQELVVSCEGGDRGLWTTTISLPGGSGNVHADSFRPVGGVLANGPAMTLVNGTVDYIVTSPNSFAYENPGGVPNAYRQTPWRCIGHPAAGYTGSLNAEKGYFGCHGTDGGLWAAQTNSAGAWGSTVPAGGRLIDGPGVAASPGLVEFSVEGTDGQLYQNQFQNGHFLGFGLKGGQLRGGAGAGGVSF